MVTRIPFILTLCCFMSLLYSPAAMAQRYRYVDSSGNIHFVNNLKQVPKQYMHQIMTPTPRPVLSKRDLARQRNEELRRKQQHEAELRRKERQREALRLEQLKEERRREKTLRAQEEAYGFRSR